MIWVRLWSVRTWRRQTADWTALVCGHSFSDRAWKGYIETHIESAEVNGLKCMQDKCNVPVPEALIATMASGACQQKYRRFLGESYVKEQASRGLIKFCPAPDCGNAMDARKATVDIENKAVTVRCFCGYEWCYRCQNESHAPASCSEIEEWNQRFTNDVETQQYLNTFCKPCPTKPLVDEFCKHNPTFQAPPPPPPTPHPHPHTPPRSQRWRGAAAGALT
jgi:ariadne-1